MIDKYVTVKGRKVRLPTEEEEAKIQEGITADPDNPELTEKDFARMRPAEEVHPEIVARYRRTRGKQKAPIKDAVSIRLDHDLVEHFKADGKGWQSRLNDALRKAVFG